MLSKHEFLKAMGIEVWSTRQSLPAAAAPLPVATESRDERPPVHEIVARPVSDASIITTQADSTPSDGLQSSPSQSQPTPEFRLAMMHYGSLGMCLLLQTDASVPRRFCDDIARFAGADVSALKYQELQWPMLATSGIDQSLSAAREVVVQKFKLLPPKMILFGDEMGTYFPPVQSMQLLSSNQFGGQTFLLLPQAPELMASVAQKRALMLALDKWQ